MEATFARITQPVKPVSQTGDTAVRAPLDLRVKTVRKVTGILWPHPSESCILRSQFFGSSHNLLPTLKAYDCIFFDQDSRISDFL